MAGKSTKICTHCNLKPCIRGRLVCNGCWQKCHHRAKQIVAGMMEGKTYTLDFSKLIGD